MPLSEPVPRVIQAPDFEQTHRTYWEQNECIFLERFLPPEVVEHHLLPEVERLRVEVHRNYISNMKDAIAYFGFSAVLRGALSHQRNNSVVRTSRPSGRS